MELSLGWPSTAMSMESLRPLSPDNFEDDQINRDVVDKLSRSELAGKLLDHFDGIQEEESDPFGWYTTEKSIDIPIFESLPSPPYNIDVKAPSQDIVYLEPPTINAGLYAREPSVPQQSLYPSSPLLATDAYDPLPSFYASLSAAQPFEPAAAVVPLAPSSVADYTFGGDDVVKDECEAAPAANSNAEWLKRETLTPPDSPKEAEIRKILEEIESAELQTLMGASNRLELPPSTASFVQPDPAPAAFSDDDDDDSSRASSASGTFDDPEWTPPARQSTRISGRRVSKSAPAKSSSAAKRRSAKPYSKSGTEERRERKKEQNKNAATRYRLKKKAEVEEVKLEETVLEERNEKLRKEVSELCREIGYLKSLMRDVYRRKGLIK